MKYFFIFFLIPIITFGQFTEFHPELEWFTLKGKYADVHFHSEAERTARVVLKIADEVWEPITSLYNYQPERVHYIIKDIDDYANGATYFFDNKIEIWASALDFDLRGQHNWLRNVISHEFTHLVQIQASLKSNRTLPAFYLQWLNYEDERRPDILYGFPNIIASYPISSINMPAWFAEGTAQYMRKEFDYDKWDTHRDMILRSYVLDGNMLTWNQMGVFGKTSLGNESVYNSGFALTLYIAQKYGEDKLRLVTEKLGKWKNWTIDAAFKDVLDKDGNEIYNEWKDYLEKDYSARMKGVIENKIQGEIIIQDGFGNFYPIFSEDSKKIYYLSNKGSDYLGQTSLYEYDFDSKKENLIKAGVRSTFSFIPGTDKIIYAKLSEDNPGNANVHDLYVYSISEKEEKRLTYNLRANQPRVSPQGDKIVFLFQKDGSSNLGLVNIDGTDFQQITFYCNGEQVYNPIFSPDGQKIVFDFGYHHTRDIASIDLDGTNFHFLIKNDSDNRNPNFDMDGNLIFSSDETGIFNLYKLDSARNKIQLTNVTGGAFMSAISSDKSIAYAGYTSKGYKIFVLNNDSLKTINPSSNYVKKINPPLGEDKPNGDITNFALDRLINFNDIELPETKKENYKGVFSKMTFFPFLRYDNYNTSNKTFEKIKPGVFLTSSDILNRYSLFAGGAINSRMERDLFLQIEYKNKVPLLSALNIYPELALEVYNITRKANVDILIDEFDPIFTDVTYSLFEVDVVGKHRLFARNSELEFRYIYSTYTATIGSFIFPGTTILYPTNSDTYLIGSNFQLKYNFESLLSYRDSEINPVGFKAEVKYNYELNKYNNDGSYTVEDGILKPLYGRYNFHRIELNLQNSLRTFGLHAVTTKVRVGSILGSRVMPDFFDFYLGGLIGMRAYPFYSINGNELLWVNLTYRFPLVRDIDARLGHLYFDKIYLSVFGDIGNAWNGSFPHIKDFKKGAGAELRLSMTSYYLFPTSLFINASYGFDSFERETRTKQIIRYGKEWRYYAGILFGFDF